MFREAGAAAGAGRQPDGGGRDGAVHLSGVRRPAPDHPLEEGARTDLTGKVRGQISPGSYAVDPIQS